MNLNPITKLTLAVLALAFSVSASEIAVSKLDLSKAVQGNWKAQVNKSTVKNKPITLGGVAYTNGIGPKGPQRVRDLWRQKDLGKQAEGFSADVPRHGCMMIRVFPEK
ncbi:MAG: NPCBM/NEW2 domain-containing protein [Verrucomicrobiota bacterium]